MVTKRAIPRIGAGERAGRFVRGEPLPAEHGFTPGELTHGISRKDSEDG